MVAAAGWYKLISESDDIYFFIKVIVVYGNIILLSDIYWESEYSDGLMEKWLPLFSQVCYNISFTLFKPLKLYLNDQLTYFMYIPFQILI